MPSEVYAFVAFRPCGCLAAAAMPEALADSLKWKGTLFEASVSGKLLTVATDKEFKALRWGCGTCAPVLPVQGELI